MTNNTTFTIHYLNGFMDNVKIPTSFPEDFKIEGNKEAAKENFQAIMKEFPAWLSSRERWIKKYKSIRESLKDNPDREYLLSLMRVKDDPNKRFYNTAQENIGIGCIYSFELVQAFGEGFFCTGPYLFVKGYTFCKPKKVFEVKIELELV